MLSGQCFYIPWCPFITRLMRFIGTTVSILSAHAPAIVLVSVRPCGFMSAAITYAPFLTKFNTSSRPIPLHASQGVCPPVSREGEKKRAVVRAPWLSGPPSFYTKGTVPFVFFSRRGISMMGGLVFYQVKSLAAVECKLLVAGQERKTLGDGMGNDNVVAQNWQTTLRLGHL